MSRFAHTPWRFAHGAVLYEWDGLSERGSDGLPRTRRPQKWRLGRGGRGGSDGGWAKAQAACTRECRDRGGDAGAAVHGLEPITAAGGSPPGGGPRRHARGADEPRRAA